MPNDQIPNESSLGSFGSQLGIDLGFWAWVGLLGTRDQNTSLDL